ncbi:MAG: hypothetical protein GC159_16455 [Phycisphaera sp.]|nr:hypothetical protein [Phycisphaera sp.]
MTIRNTLLLVSILAALPWGCSRDPAAAPTTGGGDAAGSNGWRADMNAPKSGSEQLANDPRLKRVHKGFRNVTTGMSRAEIDAAAGEPGRPVDGVFDLRIGDGDAGVTIEGGKVVGKWASSADGAWVKAVEMGMTEAEARKAMGAAPVATCPVYEWGEHNTPFRVSFYEDNAFHVTQPSLEPGLFDGLK